MKKFALHDRSYYMSDTLDCIDYIIRKHEKMTGNPLMK